ncbi:Npun_F0296 family exosortase-dependent surface protein [Phormidesmis priestleyi]
MTVVKNLAVAAAIVSAVSLSAHSAQAITFTTGGTSVPDAGLKTSVVGATTIDFESGVPSGFATYTAPSPGVAIVSPPNQANIYAAPAEDSTKYLTVAPIGDSRGTTPVTAKFAKALDYFGLYWGSIDKYNSITFKNAGAVIKTYTGLDIAPPANGNQSAAATNKYVNFFAGAGESFDEVVFSSTSNAFESDNHAYRAVPEPASIVGLLTVGALGIGSLRKRKFQKV